MSPLLICRHGTFLPLPFLPSDFIYSPFITCCLTTVKRLYRLHSSLFRRAIKNSAISHFPGLFYSTSFPRFIPETRFYGRLSTWTLGNDSKGKPKRMPHFTITVLTVISCARNRKHIVSWHFIYLVLAGVSWALCCHINFSLPQITPSNLMTMQFSVCSPHTNDLRFFCFLIARNHETFMRNLRMSHQV